MVKSRVNYKEGLGRKGEGNGGMFDACPIESTTCPPCGTRDHKWRRCSLLMLICCGGGQPCIVNNKYLYGVEAIEHMASGAWTGGEQRLVERPSAGPESSHGVAEMDSGRSAEKPASLHDPRACLRTASGDASLTCGAPYFEISPCAVSNLT